MLFKYADGELQVSKQERDGLNVDGDVNAVLRLQPKFKYVDGIERLGDMPLPFLVDLPNGSWHCIQKCWQLYGSYT